MYDKDFVEGVLQAAPNLKAYAISICHNVDRADDLLSETVTRAFANVDRFERGTNINAWLFTIMLNQFRSEYRKHRREVEDVDGGYAEKLTTKPLQEWAFDFQVTLHRIKALPPPQQKALLLVGLLGYSYEEAAQEMRCALGTVKSRVNRARKVLGEFEHRKVQWNNEVKRQRKPSEPCPPPLPLESGWQMILLETTVLNDGTQALVYWVA